MTVATLKAKGVSIRTSNQFIIADGGTSACRSLTRAPHSPDAPLGVCGWLEQKMALRGRISDASTKFVAQPSRWIGLIEAAL